MADLHVFLSYCRANKAQVTELRNELIRHGFDVWWDDHLLPGQHWKSEIRKAMKRSGAVLICLSAEVERRDMSGMFPEMRDAIEAYRQIRPESIFLIPVRLSECKIPEFPIDATTFLSDLQYVDLYPVERRADAMEKLVNALSMCPLLKRAATTCVPHHRGEHLIAQRAFRVGEGVDPIDDAITVIVFEGTSESMGEALAVLKEAFNGLVSSAYDHGDGLYEVKVHAPVGSAQLSILAQQCGIEIQSIDHIPEPFYQEFLTEVRQYMKSDDFIRRVVAETAKIHNTR